MSSLSPPPIPMELHAGNRKKLLESIRRQLSSSNRSLDGFVLLQGGEEKNRYCTDHTELFRQESYFAYLFGVREPDFYGAIDIGSGKSILFIPRLPDDYAVWLGEIKPLSHFKETYMVDMVFYVDEIIQVFNEQFKGSGKPLLYLLHGLNTDSSNFSKPASFEVLTFHPFFFTFSGDLVLCLSCLDAEDELSYRMSCDLEFQDSDARTVFLIFGISFVIISFYCCPVLFQGIDKFETDLTTLHPILAECRVIKSSLELQLIQFANDISSEAHIETFEDGDLALLDMGAEYHFYGSDITCSFPVNGKFTSDQSLIYNVSALQDWCNVD
ncbi:putative protein, fragment, partial [Arabidopsis thaliana]